MSRSFVAIPKSSAKKIAQSRAWYAANKKRASENARARYMKNRGAIAASVLAWRRANPEKVRGYERAYRLRSKLRLRGLVFKAYGHKCNCCGESNPGFLTIDHISGGGTRHTKTVARGRLYAWLVKNNFPKDDFRLLCWNCNCGRQHNAGVCPHKQEK